MSEGFATQLPSPKGNGQVRLWLKSADYAKRLLLGEAGDPWVSAAHYLAYFSQSHALVKPDVAVLEVGLGGRLDATNAVTPVLSVITSIAAPPDWLSAA